MISDLASYLTDAGVGSAATTVTEDQFVEALQAALDDSVYFTGDEAVTVSVTSAGLIQLDVAGGDGTIVVAEHSAYRGLGVSSGLAETLTGTVANASDLGNGFGTSDAAQSGTGGSIVLGATANTANGDAQDSNYVKPFGIAPLEVVANTGDELYISIDSGAETLLTIPAGDYLNMADLATAVQAQIDASVQIGSSAAVTVTVSAVQDTLMIRGACRSRARMAHRLIYSVTSSDRRCLSVQVRTTPPSSVDPRRRLRMSVLILTQPTTKSRLTTTV
jgi:hypothetical protein